MYGRHPNLPSNSIFAKQASLYVWAMDDWITRLPHEIRIIWEEVRKALEKAQQQQSYHYDKRRRGIPFEKGARVWVHYRNPRGSKLQLKFYGPYRVVQIFSSGAAQVQLEGEMAAKTVVVNCDRLSPCDERIPFGPRPLKQGEPTRHEREGKTLALEY